MNAPPQMLSPEQAAFYTDQGYVAVSGLLSDQETRAFLTHADRTPQRPRYGLHGHLQDAQYAYLAKHPKIVTIVAQLLQGRPCIVQTMLLDKPASGGKGIALQQDLHYLPHDPETPDTLMACWLALTDTDAGNGGLCVVPGSHKGGLRSAHRGQDAQEHDSFEAEYAMRDLRGREWTQKMFRFEIDDLDLGDIVRLSVPRGAGVFFCGRTIHGSFGNHSPDRPRRAFATHYVREGTHVLRRDVQNTVPVEVAGV